jgi:hypothetical protein
MLWQRSESPSSPHQVQPSIPGSDSVRQAALQASWRRDRRVAQRRIAWRWVTWYFQRFSPHALAVLTVLVGAAYLRGSLPSWSGGGDPHDTASAAVVHAPYSPPAVPTAPAPVPQPPPADTAPDLESPLTLRTSLALGAHAAAPSPYPGTETSPDTLSLKPENWLHSKEP